MDEQLAGYRGRIPGQTYIPSKARKYGLKIFWACESNTGYALNAVAYAGKEGNRIHYNLAQDIVLKVVEPWYHRRTQGGVQGSNPPPLKNDVQPYIGLHGNK